MSDILDLIDNAIEAHEVSSDAMRWTAEPAESRLTAWQQDLLRLAGLDASIIDEWLRRTYPDGAVILDETHIWLDTDIDGVYSATIPTRDAVGTMPVTFEMRQGEWRRADLDDAVPSGLSRATDPPSTERGTG